MSFPFNYSTALTKNISNRKEDFIGKHHFNMNYSGNYWEDTCQVCEVNFPITNSQGMCT